MLRKQKKNSRGRGWHGDSRGHAEAGRLGGQVTARTQNETFYSEIGRKGGRISPGNFKNNPKRAQQVGRIGGSRSRDSLSNDEE